MTSEKLLTGIMAGFVAGAVVGILFAPDKGEETRKKIAKKSTDFSDAIINGLNSLTETLSNKYESIKEDTAVMLDKGRDNVQNLKEERDMQHSIL